MTRGITERALQFNCRARQSQFCNAHSRVVQFLSVERSEAGQMWSEEQSPNNPQWFAVYVQVKHEKMVEAQLTGRGIESFLPCHRKRQKWADRFKMVEFPLFPGYVFCRIAADKRGLVLGAPGVLRIVGFGRNPVPVDDAEIEALQAVVGAGLSCEPAPYMEVGQRVRISGGPFAGIEGILMEIKRTRRLILSITLLQRSVAVEVDSFDIDFLSERRQVVSHQPRAETVFRSA